MTELSAERKLDVAVAKQFGYSVIWRESVTDSKAYPWMDSRKCGFYVESVPLYSTDLMAAFSALEAVKEQWYWHIKSPGAQGEQYQVWLGRYGHNHKHYEPAATFEALPAAICRVLLRGAREAAGGTE